MVSVDKAVIARLKKGGANFEVMVDCENAIALKEGKAVDIKDVLAVEDVFDDAKKGSMASTNQIKSIFGTDDPVEVAKIIIQKGEIQLTRDHKNKILDEKRKKIINTIAMNAVDPKTNIPHPRTRIENAFEELKIGISETEPVEKQVQDILKKLKAILPIAMETRQVSVKVPPKFSSKCHALIQKYGTIQKNEWENDGSFSCEIQIPAGMQTQLMDELNALTHGSVELKIIGEK